MKPLVPYLFFNGNCREALDFYKQCFGGELVVMTFADAPKGNECRGANPDGVMHGMLSAGKLSLMASDNPMGAPVPGDQVCLSITCETLKEIERLFGMLSADGKVLQALHDAFWGDRFGMVVDKFGMHWMLTCTLKKPKKKP